MYRHTPTPHTHTTLTPRVYKQTYNYTQITRSRPLWDHQVQPWHRRRRARRIPSVTPRVRDNEIYWGQTPVKDRKFAAKGVRTPAGKVPTTGPCQPSYARFSSEPNCMSAQLHAFDLQCIQNCHIGECLFFYYFLLLEYRIKGSKRDDILINLYYTELFS